MFRVWLGEVTTGGSGMQVLCKSSNDAIETTCTVCGQGFTLYWERHTKMERTEAIKEVAKALRSHHERHAGPEAHPERGFLVPEWNGPIAFSGAAILGNAPSWAL
jgi:hypothetical protein